MAFLAAYSRDFAEAEIRANTQSVANYFALTLADNIYPYQPDYLGVGETGEQDVRFYDPPEGDRISEVVTDSKRVLDLKFSLADNEEIEAMRMIHAAHYGPALPIIIRDYRPSPPIDIEGYFDSQPEIEGGHNLWNYSLKFREK